MDTMRFDWKRLGLSFSIERVLRTNWRSKFTIVMIDLV